MPKFMIFDAFSKKAEAHETICFIEDEGSGL